MNCVSGLKASILSLLVCAAALAQNPTANVTVDANASSVSAYSNTVSVRVK